MQVLSIVPAPARAEERAALAPGFMHASPPHQPPSVVKATLQVHMCMYVYVCVCVYIHIYM